MPHRVPLALPGPGEEDKGVLQFTKIHGRKPPSFLPTKKKLDAAGEVEGWMKPLLRDSWMYSSIALRSGMDRG